MGKGGVPPVEYRWKPGQSGNPAGRKKKHRAIADIIDPREYETIIRSLAAQAAAGKVDAARELLSRIEPARKITEMAPADVRRIVEGILGDWIQLIPEQDRPKAWAMLDAYLGEGSPAPEKTNGAGKGDGEQRAH